MDQQSARATGGVGCLLRLIWMLAGNIAFVVCAIAIANLHLPLFSGADIAMWVIVVGMIAARYFDITHFDGTTTDGHPATLAHWRRYTIVLLLVAAGVSVLLHTVFSSGS